MKPQVDSHGLARGIIVIPLGKRSPYGNDVAATGSVGGARTSARGRVGHFAEWPIGHRTVRVSGCAKARTSRRTATASAGASDRAASESRTRAAQMRPLGIAVQHLVTLVFLSKPTKPPLISAQPGALLRTAANMVSLQRNELWLSLLPNT